MLQEIAWLLFSFKGRTTRKQFWISYLMMMAISALYAGAFIAYLFTTDADINSSDFYPDMYFWIAVYFIFLITVPNAVYTKRLHDHGGSGIFSILFFYGPYFIQKFADKKLAETAMYWPLTIVSLLGFLTGLWLCGLREGEPENNEYGVTGESGIAKGGGTVST